MPRKTKQVRITSPEKMARINKSNMRLKDDFLMYLRSVQRSDGTIAGYASDLEIFFTYVLDELGNKDFQKLTKRDIIAFQNWLVSNGISSARIRRLKSAISSLSNYCELILVDDDPDFKDYKPIVRKIENPPLTPVREKTIWTDKELTGLLDELTRMGDWQKACYVALAMYGGRRKAELCRFRVSDFSDDRVVCEGALYKSAPILTKGNKYLECYTLKKKFDPYLRAWLKYREENNIESEWLFPKADNPDEHVEISTVNSWANTFSRITGKDWYAHSLRHFFVSALSAAGIPDGVVVEIMGWSSSEMFKIYDDNPKDERIAMYFKDGDIDTSRTKSIDTL
jgi:integrase